MSCCDCTFIAFQNRPYHLSIGVYFSYEEETVADNLVCLSWQTGVVASIWELLHFDDQSLSSSFQFCSLFPVNWQRFIRCVTGELHFFSWCLVVPLRFYDIHFRYCRERHVSTNQNEQQEGWTETFFQLCFLERPLPNLFLQSSGHLHYKDFILSLQST